ncbi:MAG: hypothetical protein Kow00109_02050 [Acidobacteriota bacterium]
MKKAIIPAVLLLVAATAWAAGVAGKWEGSIQTPNGDMKLTFVFEVNGETLSGKIQSDMGEQPISNGKVAGDEFSFDVNLPDGSVITHKGKVNGDTIDMTVQGPWGEWPMQLTRVQE